MKYILKENSNVILLLLALSFITDYLQYLFNPFKYISYLCQVIIWIFLLPKFFYYKKHNWYFFIICAYLIFLIFRGIFHGNFYKYLIFDIHIYTSVVFLTYFNSKDDLDRNYVEIPKLFAKLLVISIPVVFILLLKFASVDLHDPYNRGILNSNEDFDSKIFFAPIFIAPFIVPFVKEMTPRLKWTVLIANSIVLVLGILTATRSIVAVSIISFLTLIRISRKLNVLAVFTTLIIFLSAFVFLAMNKKITSILENKIELTISRFGKKTNFSNGRNTEVDGLFKEFNKSELIFGRGAGAEQKFGFWKHKPAPGSHGINFTHYGFLNLILKGGFILLFMIYGMLFYCLLKLLFAGEGRGYFFVILIFLTYEISHTLFVNYSHLVLLWIAISYALRLKYKPSYKLATRAYDY